MLTLNRLIVPQYDAASCRCCCLQNKNIAINEIYLDFFNVKRKGQGIIERFFSVVKNVCFRASALLPNRLSETFIDTKLSQPFAF